MPRPLTPLSKEKIKEYENNIRNAETKEDVKRWKRLFLEYIKNRNINITAFRNEAIYVYFAKTPRIEVLKKEIENVKIGTEKTIQGMVIFKFNKEMEGDYTDILNDYFEGKADYLDTDIKQTITDFVKEYKNSYAYFNLCGIRDTRIKNMENEIKRLKEKKYRMRAYRQKQKNTSFEKLPRDIRLQTEIDKLKIELKESSVYLEQKHKRENNALTREITRMKSELLKNQKEDKKEILKIEKKIKSKTEKLEVLRACMAYLKKNKTADKNESKKIVYIIQRFKEITGLETPHILYDYLTNGLKGYDEKTIKGMKRRIAQIEKEYNEKQKTN